MTPFKKILDALFGPQAPAPAAPAERLTLPGGMTMACGRAIAPCGCGCGVIGPHRCQLFRVRGHVYLVATTTIGVYGLPFSS